MNTEHSLEILVSLCKRRGFIYQGSEIYGGLAGTWDYGPMGVLLKKNIENIWWKHFVTTREEMYGIDSAILMNSKVWEAVGHVENFADPLVEDTKTHKRYRVDHLLKDNNIDPTGMKLEDMSAIIEEKDIRSLEGNLLSVPQQFNMMFKTSIGATAGSETTVYLRPETAQGMFVNFKNILDTFHPKLPFGIAQIGRAFRNEINARDFLFRVRELEIMEFEYFIREGEWEKWFEYWRKEIWRFIDLLGIKQENMTEHDLPKEDLAHYSKRTMDFYYNFPFGSDEIFGLAYRTDHDLKSHIAHSGVDLQYYNQETGERFIPHVIEPAFGFGRTFLAVMSEVYTEEEAPTADGKTEKRIVLKFKPALAPIKAAILPLMKKEELTKIAHEITKDLKSDLIVQYDETGSIGKRYRRQDEIGTPYCITVDYDTLEDRAVTVRDRDTMKQERIQINELKKYLFEKFS